MLTRQRVMRRRWRGTRSWRSDAPAERAWRRFPDRASVDHRCPYRETPAKIASRRAEGCVAVEMEAAALAAVAHFRGVPLGHLLYGGDDLFSAAWDNRSWQTQADVRDNLLSLAASAALQLLAASSRCIP
jgi:hypothetical protein